MLESSEVRNTEPYTFRFFSAIEMPIKEIQSKKSLMGMEMDMGTNSQDLIDRDMTMGIIFKNG